VHGKITVADKQRHQIWSFLFGHSPEPWENWKTVGIVLFRTNESIGTSAGLDIILRCYQREIISGPYVMLDIRVNNSYIFRLCNIEFRVSLSHVLFL